jgi:hypothetical protein
VVPRSTDRRRLGVVLACGLLLVLPAAAEIVDKGRDLVAEGWEEVTFRGKPPNIFIGHRDGSVEVVSEGGVSLIHRDVDVDLALTPHLGWRWRVDEAAPVTGPAAGGGEDRALAVYVSFPFDPEGATLWERMVRPFVETFAGEDAPGRIIAYVWGGEGLPGEIVGSPHLGEGGIVVVARPADAPLGTWLEERRDVARDYRELFGYEAPSPTQLAISANTDGSGTRSRGFVADLGFGAP